MELRNTSLWVTSKVMKSSLAALVISLTNCSISSARLPMLCAAASCLSFSLYSPFSSAFAFSFIAESGVLMSWDSERSSNFLSLCMDNSLLRLSSMLSRRRFMPHVNLPKKRLFSSGISTARFPFASSCGTSFSLPNGTMICCLMYKSTHINIRKIAPNTLLTIIKS